MKQVMDVKLAEFDISQMQKEKENAEAQLKEVSAQNVRLEQKLEMTQDELHQMQLTIGQQARRLKQYSDNEKDRFNLDELVKSLNRFQEENSELKELVDTLQVRDQRLDKVDSMQTELENLMKKTNHEKKQFKEREKELLSKLNIKELEMKKLYFSIQDTDFNRLESLRKDHVIENM